MLVAKIPLQKRTIHLHLRKHVGCLHWYRAVSAHWQKKERKSAVLFILWYKPQGLLERNRTQSGTQFCWFDYKKKTWKESKLKSRNHSCYIKWSFLWSQVQSLYSGEILIYFWVIRHYWNWHRKQNVPDHSSNLLYSFYSLFNFVAVFNTEGISGMSFVIQHYIKCCTDTVSIKVKNKYMLVLCFYWRHCTHHWTKVQSLSHTTFMLNWPPWSHTFAMWLGKKTKAPCKPEGCRGVSADKNLMKTPGCSLIVFLSFILSFSKN